MKRHILILGLIAVAVCLMGLSAFKNRQVFSESPAKSYFSFKYLSRVASDSEKNLYIIDRSRKRLVKVDSAGGLKFTINADEMDKASFNFINDVVADKNGYLYVLSSALDSQGYYVLSEKIARYTPGGKYEKVLYKVDYPEDNRPVTTGWLKSLKIKNDYLYFFSVQEGKVLLNQMALDGRDLKNVLNITLPEKIYLSEITGFEKGAIYYSTQKGKIYNVGYDGQSVQVYPVSDREESRKSLPKFLEIDSEKRVYFVDIIRKEINRLDPSRDLAADPLFSEATLAGQGHRIPIKEIKEITVKQNQPVFAAVNDMVVSIQPDGKIDFILDKARYNSGMIAFRWLVWLQPLLMLCLIIYAGRYVYINILDRRVSLLIKQIAVFIPIIVIPMVLISGFVYKYFASTLEAEAYNTLKLLAHYGAEKIDTDRLARITSPDNYMNEDYNAISESLMSMSEDKTISEEEIFYNLVYKVEDGQLYIAVSDDANEGCFSPYYTDDFIEHYLKVYNTGEIVTARGSDVMGNWMYALGPIYNAQGEIAGIYETGMDISGFEQMKGDLLMFIIIGMAATVGVIVIFFWVMTYFLLRSIRKLRDGANELASGKWDTVVSVKTRDEVADLCDGFNRMAENIRGYVSKITRISEAYYRFVPQQYLAFLQKDSIVDVQLGNQAKYDMSILFSNLRHFYILSDLLTPEENFNFINSYLSRMGPVIRNNGGFIDNYLGAGVMALFPGKTEDALKAAIEMRSELEVYNSHRVNSGYRPVEIGIGIHRGPLMLGIVGEEKRLQGTVISDSVNLAAILERLTEKLGASILITEDVLLDLSNPEQYQYRLLGLVRIEGREEAVRVYDVYQSDPEFIRKLKRETRDVFEEGVMLYQDGRFYDARSRFVEIVRLNFRDEAAKIYFFLCDEYFKNGAPEGWKGILSA